jgi:membrane-associated PAP2 superfamily phosphatase
VTGLYKMVIGDHFLSHTIISMLLAWLIACLVAYFILCRPPSDTVSEVNDYGLSID